MRLLSDMVRSSIENDVGLKCMDMQDGDIPRSGICSFDVAPLGSAEFVVDELLKRGMSVSTSGVSSTLVDAITRGLPEKMVRFSPHYFNTEEEVVQVVEALKLLKK